MAKESKEQREAKIKRLVKFYTRKPGEKEKILTGEEFLAKSREMSEQLKPLADMARSYLPGGSNATQPPHRSKGKGR